MPPLCTYRLNWVRRTSWGWWDNWDDTVLQTQDSKFKPWRSEAEHANSRSRRFPTILTFTRGWGRNMFCFFQTAKTGNRTPSSGMKGANHYPRAPALLIPRIWPYNKQKKLNHRWANVEPTLQMVDQRSPANTQIMTQSSKYQNTWFIGHELCFSILHKTNAGIRAQYSYEQQYSFIRYKGIDVLLKFHV